MKTISFKYLCAILLPLLLLLNACKKDTKDVALPINPNETELITTVQLEFSTLLSPRTIYYSYKDMDGDGGITPTIDTLKLLENTTYTLRVLLLDETKTPVDTISNEIETNEKNAHQFFYSKSGVYDLTTTYLDSDDNGVPVGLEVSILTGSGFTTKNNAYKIVLKHQPGLKPTTGNGDNTIGETDIEVDFPIIISIP